MRDFLLHQICQMTPAEFILVMAGSFFIGVFLAIIIRVKKESIKYIESDKKPWRMSLVIGFRGSKPVFEVMYSPEFVRFLYEKWKGCQAKISALKQIGGEE